MITKIGDRVKICYNGTAKVGTYGAPVISECVFVVLVTSSGKRFKADKNPRDLITAESIPNATFRTSFRVISESWIRLHASL